MERSWRSIDDRLGCRFWNCVTRGPQTPDGAAELESSRAAEAERSCCPRKPPPGTGMASGGYVHVQLNPSGAPNVGYGRNTACVRDPYYHLAKDKSYVTYPDAQDTADRLRAIRSVAEDVKRTAKITWPFYPAPAPAAPAAVYVSSVGGAYASATPGLVMQPQPQQSHLYVQGCAPHPPLRQPATTTWVASRRLPADDPERSLQFWENSRHTATARVAEANEKATARVAAALPDRVHSSMWHHHHSEEEIRANGPAAGSEPEPEPEPEAATPTFAGSAAHPPVFSAEVSQAAALYRAERKRHALSVPQVRLSNGHSLATIWYWAHCVDLAAGQALLRDGRLPASAADHLHHPHHHAVCQAPPPHHGVSSTRLA
jgi:hypothetical protein